MTSKPHTADDTAAITAANNGVTQVITLAVKELHTSGDNLERTFTSSAIDMINYAMQKMSFAPVELSKLNSRISDIQNAFATTIDINTLVNLPSNCSAITENDAIDKKIVELNANNQVLFNANINPTIATINHILTWSYNHVAYGKNSRMLAYLGARRLQLMPLVAEEKAKLQAEHERQLAAMREEWATNSSDANGITYGTSVRSYDYVDRAGYGIYDYDEDD